MPARKRFWSLPSLPEMVKPPPIIIVQRGEPLTENEIKAAFQGNENAQWYKALVQIIDGDRHAEALNAAAASKMNNAMATASANGAYEFASGLLNTLAGYAETKD